MDKEKGKSYLMDYVQTYLKLSKGDMYQCPLCGSGSSGQANSDGAFSLNPNTENTRWYCFACGQQGDIYDLVQKLEGLEVKDSFQRVAELYGLETEDSFYRNPPTTSTAKMLKNDKVQIQPLEAPRRDFSDYLYQSTRRLLEGRGDPLNYILNRGFTEETVQRFHLGADGRAITIPYNREGTYYIKRNIDPQAKYRYEKPKKAEAGEEPVFNQLALYTQTDEVVYVVESPFCAIAIIQEGGQAIAIGGTGQKKLTSLLESKPTNKILLLSLDNDKAGDEAMTQLESRLVAMKIPSMRFNVSGVYKDPNDHLTADRGHFRATIEEGNKIIVADILDQQHLAYKKNCAKNYIQDFVNGIAERAKTAFIPTGFPELDKLLDGGLYEGLYVIGAISSLGKTTYSLQIADNIAKQGHDVLFFSLEMARSELMAKSISRETIETILSSGGCVSNAKTTRGITTGKKWETYSDAEMDLIATAISNYEEYSENMYIFEGIGDIGIDSIVEQVKRHIQITKRKPTVFIDYLQILAPSNERSTDKQNTDKATLELKRLSRDFKIPVWAISSFNRDNYTQPVNTASFKESGAIEYSSDVLIGLQHEGMEYQKGESEKDRTARIREEREKREEDIKKGNPISVEAKILKNRNGLRGKSTLHFHPQFNFYKETQVTQRSKKRDIL